MSNFNWNAKPTPDELREMILIVAWEMEKPVFTAMHLSAKLLARFPESIGNYPYERVKTELSRMKQDGITDVLDLGNQRVWWLRERMG